VENALIEVVRLRGYPRVYFERKGSLVFQGI
jgi:hypothetical protein